MTINLQLVGCSHHHSDLSIREQLVFSESQIPPFLDRFYRAFPGSEAVLLSTCNRTELYVASRRIESLPSDSAIIELLAHDRKLSPRLIQDELFCHRDRNAIRHLFSVTSSIDSMVIGETQILSQVKRAYQLASELNQSISLSHQIFQTAIRVAKRVSNETNLHSARLSVPSVAICVLAKQVFERLDNKRILVLGAGEMARETLRYVRSEGGSQIVVINRTTANAVSLANEFQGRVAEWDDLASEIARADLLICTTGSPLPIVNSSLFDTIESQRKQRPLLILDLAVPRNVEAEIGDRINVYVYTLDDLQRECERNLMLRKSQLEKAQVILDHETDNFLKDLEYRANGTTIALLKRRADEIKQAELLRLRRKLDGQLDDRSQQEIEAAFHRLVNKLLDPPLQSIREEESQLDLVDALKRLFQLND